MPGVPRCALVRFAATVALAAFAAAAAAAELAGRVVAIADGDTLELLTAERTRVRVRLFAIDAPERGQPYGTAARRALSDLAHGRQALVVWAKADDFGRVVGTVFVEGADVNLRMIERGLAWHYKAYAREQSAPERQRYAAAEAAARTRRVGLWREVKPVPPWQYRRANGAGAPPGR
jgi:endonuclease YncB( thermonuclease family)